MFSTHGQICDPKSSGKVEPMVVFYYLPPLEDCVNMVLTIRLNCEEETNYNWSFEKPHNRSTNFKDQIIKS